MHDLRSKVLLLLRDHVSGTRLFIEPEDWTRPIRNERGGHLTVIFCLVWSTRQYQHDTTQITLGQVRRTDATELHKVVKGEHVDLTLPPVYCLFVRTFNNKRNIPSRIFRFGNVLSGNGCNHERI